MYFLKTCGAGPAPLVPALTRRSSALVVPPVKALSLSAADSLRVPSSGMSEAMVSPAHLSGPRELAKESQPCPQGFGRLLDHSSSFPALGGHRGHGANYWRSDGDSPVPRFRVRENTVASFAASIAAGASFVEFDVQVTRDGVPIIWHDNYVITGSAAAPVSRTVSELSFSEFRSLLAARGAASLSDQGARHSEATGAGPDQAHDPHGGAAPLGSAGALLRALRHDSPAEVGDPSLRPWECDEEDAVLPCLADLFATLDPCVAFDLEVKLATPPELVVTPPAEIDRLLTPILATVDAARDAAVAAGRGPREVVFSSFDPDLCAELRRRVPGGHVMFLSGGGAYEHADARRTSLAAALDWAAAAHLDGVIVHSARLRAAPEFAADTRAAGLRLMSYGVENSDADWVAAQFALGVHGVIVDDVTGVVRGLTNLHTRTPGPDPGAGADHAGVAAALSPRTQRAVQAAA